MASTGIFYVVRWFLLLPFLVYGLRRDFDLYDRPPPQPKLSVPPIDAHALIKTSISRSAPVLGFGALVGLTVSLLRSLKQRSGLDADEVYKPGATKSPSFSSLSDMSMRNRNIQLLKRGTKEYGERLRGSRHFIGSTGVAGERKCCVLCTRAGAGKKGELKVSHYCKQCGVYLYVECFEAWHCEPEPKSPKFENGVVRM